MSVLKQKQLAKVPGSIGFGHVRYATQGRSTIGNSQPVFSQTEDGPFLYASNGDLPFYHEGKERLQKLGFTFKTNVDAEVGAHELAFHYNQYGDWIKAICAMKKSVVGSYSSVLLTTDAMYLFTDYLENRPLSYLKSPSQDSLIFSSETCSARAMRRGIPSFEDQENNFTALTGDTIIEMRNGRIIEHVESNAPVQSAPCIFELIYFSNPASNVFGVSVYQFRKELARKIAEEARPRGDVIAGIPDSGVPAAQELSNITGIPIEPALIRSHYTGRTFIEPEQEIRDFNVEYKFCPIPGVIEGKRVILIDDSIVRGTTMLKVLQMVLECKPRQIILLITSPMILWMCFLGIDMKKWLLAAMMKKNIEAIKYRIGLRPQDVLQYLSLEGLRSIRPDARNWCDACFSGDYPFKGAEKLVERQVMAQSLGVSV